MSPQYRTTDAEKKAEKEAGGSKMEIRLLEKTESTASFLLKGSTPAFANLIRRSMTEDVPVMAIEDVEFKENSSLLYDEIIAHRLGLTPLTTELKSYTLPGKCKCEGKGCARCTVKLTLKASEPGMVNAESLKSKDPEIRPAFPKTPIVKLIKGQELEFEAAAVLGQGKTHAKWCPGSFHYKYKPEVEIAKEPADAEATAKSCPQKVFETKNGKLAIIKDNMLKCHLCQACIEEGAVSVKGKDDEFIFYMESYGQLPCKEIAVKAAEMAEEKLTELEEALEKPK
jgi:DNA-directed RNA polymerase subunit D